MATKQQTKAVEFKSADLEKLGKSLADLLALVRESEQSQLDAIRETAKGHSPLKASEMTAKAKKGYRADIIRGLASATHLTDASRAAYASAFFRALVYASNGILPTFTGMVSEYNKACADTKEGQHVYAVQVRTTGANVGKGLKGGKAAAHSPSKPETYTHAQMVAELFRFANMLGWGKEVKALIATKQAEAEKKVTTKAKTTAKAAPRRAAKQAAPVAVAA